MPYNYIFINNTFRNAYYLAYNIELRKGMNALSILSTELREFWKSKYDMAISGTRQSFIFSEKTHDKVHYFEVLLNPLYIDGNIAGVSSISIDIADKESI